MCSRPTLWTYLLYNIRGRVFRTHLFTTFWYFDSEGVEHISSVHPLLIFCCLYMYSSKLKFTISIHMHINLRIIIDAFNKLLLVLIHLGSTVHKRNSVYFKIKLISDVNKIIKQIFTKIAKVRNIVNNNNFDCWSGPDQTDSRSPTRVFIDTCSFFSSAHSSEKTTQNAHMSGTNNAKTPLKYKKRINLKSEDMQCQWNNMVHGQGHENTYNTNYANASLPEMRPMGGNIG